MVESFAVKAAWNDLGGGIDDAMQSCDGDGKLDASEKRRVTVEVRNTGVVELTDAVGTITASKPGITFPTGMTINFGTIQPFETAKATVDIEMAAGAVDIDTPQLEIAVFISAEGKKEGLQLEEISV